MSEKSDHGHNNQDPNPNHGNDGHGHNGGNGNNGQHGGNNGNHHGWDVKPGKSHSSTV